MKNLLLWYPKCSTCFERPLFINEKVVLVGFKEKEWRENI